MLIVRVIHFWIIFFGISDESWLFFNKSMVNNFLPNLVTAIFGSLLLFSSLYFNKENLNNVYYSLLASAIVFANPIIWRWSEIAMSDIFALFFIFYAIVFFIDFTEKDKINIYG